MGTRSTPLLLVIAALLIVDIALRALAPTSAPALVPQALAQNRPTEVTLRTGSTFVTTSGDGGSLFVWQCTVVNAKPTFECLRFDGPR